MTILFFSEIVVNERLVVAQETLNNAITLFILILTKTQRILNNNVIFSLLNCLLNMV